MTYAYVVSKGSVKFVPLVADINVIDVKYVNVQNAYLNSNTKERVYFYAGEEFCKYSGKLVVLVRALYGLKFSRSAYAAAIRQVKIYLRFQPFMDDAYVWMR